MAKKFTSNNNYCTWHESTWPLPLCWPRSLAAVLGATRRIPPWPRATLWWPLPRRCLADGRTSWSAPLWWCSLVGALGILVILNSYVHMSCVLYDDKVHILRYMEDVKKFEDTNIQLRKILMTPNMIKSTYNEQWNPATICGCITTIKPMKKCRLVDLPHISC